MFLSPRRIALVLTLLGAAAGQARARPDGVAQRLPVGPPEATPAAPPPPPAQPRPGGAPLPPPQAPTYVMPEQGPVLLLPEHGLPGPVTAVPERPLIFEQAPAAVTPQYAPANAGACPCRQGQAPPPAPKAAATPAAPAKASRWRLFRRRTGSTPPKGERPRQ
jgi:hypothetical protein